MFALERDANAIGQQTRRGKGNIIICSADVASALQMAGVLDYTPALNNNLNVDDTSATFAGVMNGRFKVYVDPYAANVAASQYYVTGYKGTSPFLGKATSSMNTVKGSSDVINTQTRKSNFRLSKRAGLETYCCNVNSPGCFVR